MPVQVYAQQQAAAFLASWLPYRFNQTDLPSLSVAVTHQGTPVLSGQYGHARLQPTVPITQNYVYGVASQSKMFASVAALQLAEQGKLALDTPVARYIPWFKKHSNAWAQIITPRQLLTHCSGLARDVPQADFWLLEQPFPGQKELQTALLATPVLVEPNTQLKYSNAGYALLGQVIAAVSGQPYTTYIQQHIIAAIGLKNTFADYTPARAKRVATGYSTPYAGTRHALPARQATNAFAPVVGLHSTASDMCHFVTALCNNDERLLSRASTHELLRTHWTQPDGYDAGQAFGMGFEVLEVNGRRILGHSGHIGGHVSATFFDPASGTAVAVMGNSKDTPITQIATGILETLDFFAAHASKPALAALGRLNARLFSPIAHVQIVATSSNIVAIDPDDWQPFAFLEELEQIDTNTLRITTPGSIFNEAELVRYRFIHNKLQSVTFAGGTMLPEGAYRAKYVQTKSR